MNNHPVKHQLDVSCMGSRYMKLVCESILKLLFSTISIVDNIHVRKIALYNKSTEKYIAISSEFTNSRNKILHECRDAVIRCK